MAKIFLKKTPQAKQGNIYFSGFTTFSEYWKRHKGLDCEDVQIINIISSQIDDYAIAIDVGGNLGLFSLTLASRGFSVYAFEPIPETFELMQKNISLNPELAPKIKTTLSGCGSKNEATEFVISKLSPGQNKMLPVVDQSEIYQEIQYCEVITLDSFLEQHSISQIDFLKIDVEGFETEVLKGATNFLRNGKIKFIYAEVIPQAFIDAGSSVEEFLQILSDSGFCPISVDLYSDSKPILEDVDFQLVTSLTQHSRNMLFRCQNYAKA